MAMTTLSTVLALVLSLAFSGHAFQVQPSATKVISRNVALNVASVQNGYADNFRNGIQAAFSFLQQPTKAEYEYAYASSSEEMDEDSEWEWAPYPPESSPPAYLLKELTVFEKTVKKMDYGGMRNPNVNSL